MTDLHEEAFVDAAFDEVIQFASDANPFAQNTWGWDTGRLVDWRWGSNTVRAMVSDGRGGADLLTWQITVVDSIPGGPLLPMDDAPVHPNP